MNLKELFDSKRFIKNGVQFGTPSEYLNPFVDIVNAKFPDISIRVSDRVENAEDSGEVNVSFARGLIEMKGLEIEGVRQIIGMVYALDVQKPIYKIYAGTEVSACLNLQVFRPDELFTGFILDDMQKGYNFARQVTQNYEKIFEEYMTIQKALQNNVVKTEDMLGKLLNFAIDNRYVGITTVTNAAIALKDSKSSYYAPEGECSMYNIFNACTEHLSHKSDISDKASKTVLLSKFKDFNINN